MLHFLCTGLENRACTWLAKSWIPHCMDESMMGNCLHVVFQKNISNLLASNNVERIRDHPCPLMAPVLTRRLQASPAQRWIAAILKIEGASILSSMNQGKKSQLKESQLDPIHVRIPINAGRRGFNLISPVLRPMPIFLVPQSCLAKRNLWSLKYLTN